jgi:hypothetical protein
MALTPGGKENVSFARGGIMPDPEERSVQEGEDHGFLRVPYAIFSSSFAERNHRIKKDGLGS